MWELTYRGRDADQATHIKVEAPTSVSAIDNRRSKIPADEIALYIRRLD